MIRKQRLIIFAIIGISLALMLFGWWSGTGHGLTSHSAKLIAIGRLAGIVATAAVLLELLVMSRAPFIENNFDLEEINEFHRYNGYTMTYALLTHIVFLVMGYGIVDKLGWWNQFWGFTSQFEDVLKTIIGSAVFFAVALTSMHIMRKRLPYEVWYFMHILVYGGVLLAFGHQVHSGSDVITQKWMLVFWYGIYGLVFGLLAYYRFGRHIMLYLRHGFKVERVVQESPDIFSIYISGRSINKYRFAAGQYAHWRFLSSNLLLESHPFSFSSAPGSDLIRLTFKASGDYTKQLLHVQPGTAVLIDGPRGSFTSKRSTTSKVLLIAGGIGVAPFMAIAKELLQQGKHVQVLYSVTKRQDIVFSSDFKLLQEVADNRFVASAYVSSERGRLNEITLSRYLATNTATTTVYVCGPDPMTTALKKMLPTLGVPNKHIIAERFIF